MIIITLLIIVMIFRPTWSNWSRGTPRLERFAQQEESEEGSQAAQGISLWSNHPHCDKVWSSSSLSWTSSSSSSYLSILSLLYEWRSGPVHLEVRPSHPPLRLPHLNGTWHGKTSSWAMSITIMSRINDHQYRAQWTLSCSMIIIMINDHHQARWPSRPYCYICLQVLRVMHEQFTPDERFGGNAATCTLSTPKDATATHILVFPTSATAQVDTAAQQTWDVLFL